MQFNNTIRTKDKEPTTEEVFDLIVQDYSESMEEIEESEKLSYN